MAVVFDAASLSTNVTGAGGNWSWTHTPVGTPTGVAIGVGIFASGGVTGVTYGGVTCTQSVIATTAANDEDMVVYTLANPPSGPQTVVVATTGFVAGQGCAVTVTGGNTTTVLSGTATANDGGTTATSQSITLTGGATGDLAVDFLMFDKGGTATFTPGGGQTQIVSGAGNIYVESSWKAGGSSVGFSWSEGNPGNWAYVAVSFKTAGGAGDTFANNQSIIFM